MEIPFILRYNSRIVTMGVDPERVIGRMELFENVEGSSGGDVKRRTTAQRKEKKEKEEERELKRRGTVPYVLYCTFPPLTAPVVKSNQKIEMTCVKILLKQKVKPQFPERNPQESGPECIDRKRQ